MQLTTQQLELQEAILKRLYPWVSIEEIRKKENRDDAYIKVWIFNSKSKTIRNEYFKVYEIERNLVSRDGIIWLPPTLPRILTALWDEYFYSCWCIEIYVWADTWDKRYPLHYIKRQLLNEDMTDRNLREQDQETQDILHSIFCK